MISVNFNILLNLYSYNQRKEFDKSILVYLFLLMLRWQTEDCERGRECKTYYYLTSEHVSGFPVLTTSGHQAQV